MPKTFLFFLAFLTALTSQNLGISKALAAEETVADGSGESILDDPDYDPNHPYFFSLRPKWAIGVRVGVHKVPVSGALGDIYQLYGEYLFPFQHIGVFSIGPHGGVIPLSVPETAIPYPNYGNFSVGVTARYQLKIMTEQWVVPTIGLEWDYYRVQQDRVTNTHLTGNYVSFTAGLMLNLGFIDTMTARDAYQSLGLLRSYLTLELKTANINNELFILDGNFWLMGLRLEFE